MAYKMLDSGTLSAYCESMAIMFSAGIQTDEALHLLGENMQDEEFKDVVDAVYRDVSRGISLAEAMGKTGAFPKYALEMIEAGEFSGRLENTLVSLAKYYDEENRLFSKIRSAIAYPAALLAIMTVILLFTTIVILPVFLSVYEGFAGSLTSGSYMFVNAAIIIGWVAFGLSFLATVIVTLGVLMTRTPSGRQKMLKLFERMPITRGPLRQMAIGRFTSALAIYVASGINTDVAMTETIGMVTHNDIRKKLERAHEEMIDPEKVKSLAQAIYDNNVFDPIYSRMLVVGSRSGSLETVLENLSGSFFDDSIARLDRTIDSVEPALAAFLTIAVGATLIAVMLPLIGIMGSIG